MYLRHFMLDKQFLNTIKTVEMLMLYTTKISGLASQINPNLVKLYSAAKSQKRVLLLDL